MNRNVATKRICFLTLHRELATIGVRKQGNDDTGTQKVPEWQYYTADKSKYSQTNESSLYKSRCACVVKKVLDFSLPEKKAFPNF